MYPMDRIQQKHARQIDLLENLTAVIQDYPNPALMNPLMILVKIIKLRWIHILSYDQMVSRKI
ncbi:protein TraJ, partial [Escherichia coli]